MNKIRLILTALAVFSPSLSAAEPFTLESKGDGAWSNAATWQPERQPKAGDKVLIQSGHAVVYDANSPDLIPLLHVEGSLVFARDRDTELNVAVLKVGGGKEKHSGVEDVPVTRWHQSAHAWKSARPGIRSPPGSPRGSDCTTSMGSTKTKHRY